MRFVPKIIFAACVVLALCTPAQMAMAQLAAPQAANIDSVAPFHPSLVVNEEPQVCAPFLKAWTAEFDAPKRLEEDQVDIAALYPSGRVTRLKEFYETPQRIAVDLDGDHENELLYFDPGDFNWRYIGPTLYLFDSEKDIQAVEKAMGPAGRWGWHLDSNKRVEGASYRPIAELGPIRAFDLLQLDGRAYFTHFVGSPTEDMPSSAVLSSLNATGAPVSVCVVELLPAKKTFAKFRDGAQWFAGLRDVYGEQSYHGSMGWTADPNDHPLMTLLYRPWAMKAVGRFSNVVREESSPRNDVARELRYLFWGASDPQSWRDYLDVKEGRASFIADLQRHYMTCFGKTGGEALAMAEDAWRYQLDLIIYARNGSQYGLQGGALDPGAGLAIGPGTPPAEIVRLLIDHWRAGDPQRAKNREQNAEWARATSRALLIAAIHTRQPIPVVRQMAQEEMGFIANSVDDMLLASLGHNGLTNLVIDFGANFNAQTGYANKTPLMYAAQLDRLNAVQLLIARGADTRLATNSNEGGYHLKRDQRTALMYAAENASPPVIDAILAAGADIAAKDTQGNTALWYFGRNAKITDSALRARLAARLGG